MSALAEDVAWSAVDAIAEAGGPIQAPTADVWSPAARALLGDWLRHGTHCEHAGPWVVAVGGPGAACAQCLAAADGWFVNAIAHAVERCAGCSSEASLNLYGGSCADGQLIAIVAVCNTCDSVPTVTTLERLRR